MARSDDLLAQCLGEIGFAQDTREQMRAEEERQWLAQVDVLANFAAILELDEIEEFLFD